MIEVKEKHIHDLSNARSYVSAWIMKKNYIVNVEGQLCVQRAGESLDIFNTMWLDYLEQLSAYNAGQESLGKKDRQPIKGFLERDLKKALDEYCDRGRIHIKESTDRNIACDKEDLTEIERFVFSLKGQIDKLDVAVLAHWIWMVKRKMLKQDVTDHIMPILFGKQGGGKTVALHKFIKPISDYRMNLKMNQMTDDRYFEAMSERYVVVFDEMQGVSRTDIDSLKNQITCDWNDARIMRTNRVLKRRQSCSFIGATNKPVGEQIIDHTGMRRFWEIKCLDILNWDELNKINYIALWKGVNEKSERGYLYNHLDQIKVTQDELMIQEDIDAFFSERSVYPPVDGCERFKLDINIIYSDYKKWCVESNCKPYNKIWFGKKASSKGLKIEIKSQGKGKKKVYLIAPGSDYEEKKEKLSFVDFKLAKEKSS